MNPRAKLLLLLVLFSVPTLASFMTFFLMKAPSATSNYGELLSPAVPLPPLTAAISDGGDLGRTREPGLRGKWLMVTLARGGCDSACEKNAYTLRQARLVLGRDMDRVARVVLMEGGSPPTEAARQAYAGTAWVADPPPAWKAVLSSGRPDAAAIFLVDPLGNAFMRYGAEPDSKRFVQDLKQVLKASQIG